MVGVSREAAATRRRAIVAAVVAELAANGPHGLAVTSVAARAGTAPTAVYRRFDSADALLAAAVEEHLAPATAAWRAGRSGAIGDPDGPARRPSPAPEVDAWAHLLVGGAWPGPARRSATALLAHASPAPGPSPDAARLAVALDLGLWLVARSEGSTPRWDRRHAALLTAALPGGARRLGIARSARVETAPAADRPGPAYPPVDDLGRQLLRATGAVIADRGAAAPVGEIARRAGASTGALYNRFSGKAGLLAEALVSRAPEVHTAVASLAPPTDDELFALRVAALASAPSEPEVAAAVAAVEHRARRALRRRLLPDRCAGLPAATAATALAALPLGQWVVGRVGDHGPAWWAAPNRRLASAVGLGGGSSR